LEELEDGYPASTGYPSRHHHCSERKTMATMPDPHVHYLAHHWLLLAGPAFVPAIAVVGVVLYVAIRDRRRADSGEQASADDRKD
jgi:hypothetical protein